MRSTSRSTASASEESSCKCRMFSVGCPFGSMHEPLARLRYLGTHQHGKTFQIIATLRTDLVADTPDFFQQIMFHKRLSQSSHRKCMKTIGIKGFLPGPNAMGRSVPAKTPAAFQITNKINGFEHVSYGTALKDYWLSNYFASAVCNSGSTHLLCSLMRSTSRSTASASGMLNLIGVLPT